MAVQPFENSKQDGEAGLIQHSCHLFVGRADWSPSRLSVKTITTMDMLSHDKIRVELVEVPHVAHRPASLLTPMPDVHRCTCEAFVDGYAWRCLEGVHTHTRAGGALDVETEAPFEPQ